MANKYRTLDNFLDGNEVQKLLSLYMCQFSITLINFMIDRLILLMGGKFAYILSACFPILFGNK